MQLIDPAASQAVGARVASQHLAVLGDAGRARFVQVAPLVVGGAVEVDLCI
jgi:hypothetical protein